MKYYYWSFLVLVFVFVLEIVAYIITEIRNQNEQTRRDKEEERDLYLLGVLSACYHHATRTLKETHGIYLCALSHCCWKLRNDEPIDPKVAITALRGLGYIDNADELEGRMGIQESSKIDIVLEKVLEDRRKAGKK